MQAVMKYQSKYAAEGPQNCIVEIIDPASVRSVFKSKD